MQTRPLVMLDVIAVVEEQCVVDASVMTGRTPRVFEMPLEKAEAESEQIARQINSQRERWCVHEQRGPESCHEHRLDNRRRSCRNSLSRVVCQMSRPPQTLRNPEHQAQID